MKVANFIGHSMAIGSLHEIPLLPLAAQFHLNRFLSAWRWEPRRGTIIVVSGAFCCLLLMNCSEANVIIESQETLSSSPVPAPFPVDLSASWSRRAVGIYPPAYQDLKLSIQDLLSSPADLSRRSSRIRQHHLAHIETEDITFG